MVQWLRPLLTLAEDLGSVSNTHMGWLAPAQAPVPGGGTLSPWVPHIHAAARACMQARVYSHKIKTKISVK